jgi:hypothetical protein
MFWGDLIVCYPVITTRNAEKTTLSIILHCRGKVLTESGVTQTLQTLL